ncbi:MAG: FKBP-type peptidyl-prolyl cis-trans isomerase [Saprospiraceae bacterium]|nr:FKBP-type peptidyl-prolyl cis-trans isomerase [Saprospiraceae bacterium]
MSYAMCVVKGQNLNKQNMTNIDYAMFDKALQAAVAGKETKMDFNTANKLVTEYQVREKQAVGKKFLEENGKRKGVVTLPSGLQYEVLVEGAGEMPKTTDKVKVHYTGTLIDGTVFDSSVKRGEPIVFPVTGVIKGWVEALQLMKTGSKWKLFIPYNLAYGERGAGANIGPYSTLIFEVELISIEK